jgi:hypothetical protein
MLLMHQMLSSQQHQWRCNHMCNNLWRRFRVSGGQVYFRLVHLMSDLLPRKQKFLTVTNW